MAQVIAGMVMSLDGYVAGRDGDLSRIYADFDAMVRSDAVQDAIRTTGAVVMGRRSYEMGEGDFSGYEFQTPIFVVTHVPPVEPAAGQNDRLMFTFVTDGVESAIAQAKQSAGANDVIVVGGPDVIRQCLKLGLVDELHIDIRSLLLFDGLPLFERTERAPVELEVIDVTQSPGVTHMRYRVMP